MHATLTALSPTAQSLAPRVPGLVTRALVGGRVESSIDLRGLSHLISDGLRSELEYMTPDAELAAHALEAELILDARAGVSLIGRLAMTAASAPATALEIEAEALQTAADLRDGLAYRIERENAHATDWSY